MKNSYTYESHINNFMGCDRNEQENRELNKMIAKMPLFCNKIKVQYSNYRTMYSIHLHIDIYCIRYTHWHTRHYIQIASCETS